jgi:4'-phosphopantetheinyl transferase
MMLQPTRVRVYIASTDCLEDPALYQKALSVLPVQRVEYARRLKTESGKRQSAGAGLLLMAALADLQKDAAGSGSSGMRCTGSGIEMFRALRFAQGEHGKPYLPDHPQVHFNLSHSGSRVMCIMGPAACGCDVEKTDRSEKQIRMVIRCLAESEQRQAARSAVDFFRIWTLKESILKLSGEGIAIPMNSFEVSLKPLSVRQDFFAGQMELKEYEEEQYRCACALAGSGLPDEMTRVALEKLLM